MLIGTIGIIALVVLLVFGVQIALALMVVGFLGVVAATGNFTTGTGLLRTVPFGSVSSWALIVVPLFILMGMLSVYGGISDGPFRSVKYFLGRVPGSLSIATVWACVAFGAASGSNLAAATLFTKLSLPEMKRAGYDVKAACGLIAVSSSIAMLIPPSLYFVIYGVMTDESIAKLLIAGVFPGLITAGALTAIVLVTAIRNPRLGPPVSSKMPWKEKIASLPGIWPALVMALLVLGGIYSGISTATEAAATGAFGAFMIGLIQKGLNWDRFKTSLFESAEFTAMLFFIFIGATVFARFLAVCGFTREMSEMIVMLNLGGTGTVIGLTFLYLVLGCFMGPLEIMAITLPIFFKPLMDLGVDPIWLGVVVTVSLLIGSITPPFGLAVYTVAAVARADVTTDEVFSASMPYLIGLFVCLALVIAFPQLSLYLPYAMKGR